MDISLLLIATGVLVLVLIGVLAWRRVTRWLDAEDRKAFPGAYRDDSGDDNK